VVAVTSSHDTFSISPQLESAFLRAVRDSVSNWDEMRAAEGSVLEQDLRTRGFQICGFAERMEQMRQDAVPLAQKKLRERLQQWLGQSGFDSARLAQEAALLAERTDISEEVLRLKAHSAQFVEMLGGGMEIGKKLDFLLQEIQRELNTLMAKTTGLGDSSLAMTQLALDIKGEVEKLREQVLNLQ
jgi:uncharacterized protein (TIGR00255 family)